MKRYTQKIEDIVSNLSEVETNWKDEFSDSVIERLESFSKISPLSAKNARTHILSGNYDIDSTIIRLFLEKSKDEYNTFTRLKSQGKDTTFKKLYLEDPDKFFSLLDESGLSKTMETMFNTSYTWKDILIERLKAGRGSAIKGQARGRSLENFVEDCVKGIFKKYDIRCSFKGKTGLSSEKADFAIPSKDAPEIVIEVKAYGATGSKQTDVIGDIIRIIETKRSDTALILFTDGLSWKDRESDLKKLVRLQNEGAIYKIYTQAMRQEFISNLKQFKEELELD